MAHQEPTATSNSRMDSRALNSEILGPLTLTYPPTLDDIERLEPPTILDKLYILLAKLRPLNSFPAWENSETLADLLWMYQFDDRLPPPTADDHSVYLVGAARDHSRRSYGHWSFYSQGYFFHLTAARSNKKQFEDAICESKSPYQPDGSTPVALKVQNLLDPDEPGFVRSTEKTQRTALQAYHVGYTRFGPQQLRQLALFVIGTLGTYNFFERNCQLFVISMLNRTVMFQRDRSIFVGNIHQIVEWDLRTGDPDRRYYSKATGYLLTGPQAKPTKWYHSAEAWHRWPLVLWTGNRVSRRATRIATLYRDGEQAIGAFDPSGEREGMRYILHLFHLDMKDVLPADERAEIWDDLKHRRWHDFCFGRPERRKAGYLRLETRARRGDTTTKVLLPFHRWCLRISEAERRMWLEEEGAAVEDAA